MKNDEVKKYLNQISFYNSRINSKLERRDRLKAMMTKITPTLRDDAVSGGHGSQDKLSDGMAELIDLEADINREIDSYVNAIRDVSKTIDEVEDEKQYKVLDQRYVHGKTLEQIAVEMGYTYRNICYIHGDALESVRSIINRKRQTAGDETA